MKKKEIQPIGSIIVRNAASPLIPNVFSGIIHTSNLEKLIQIKIIDIPLLLSASRRTLGFHVRLVVNISVAWPLNVVPANSVSTQGMIFYLRIVIVCRKRTVLVKERAGKRMFHCIICLIYVTFMGEKIRGDQNFNVSFPYLGLQ